MTLYEVSVHRDSAWDLMSSCIVWASTAVEAKQLAAKEAARHATQFPYGSTGRESELNYWLEHAEVREIALGEEPFIVHIQTLDG